MRNIQQYKEDSKLYLYNTIHYTSTCKNISFPYIISTERYTGSVIISDNNNESEENINE